MTDPEDLVFNARQQLEKDLALVSVLQNQIETQGRIAAGHEEARELFDKAAALLNTLGEERQHEAQEMIEGLVTRGLQTIFEPNLSLVISTSVKGKTTSTEFLIRTEGDEPFETSVMDARGGGLVAVTAFLLRVTVLLLTHPEDRRLLVIDESFAHLSEEYQEGVSAFLRELVDETGLQIIMVTHQPAMAQHATSSLEFSQIDGKTVLA